MSSVKPSPSVSRSSAGLASGPAPGSPAPVPAGTVNAQPARHPAISSNALIARRSCDGMRYAVTMKRREGLTRRDWVRFITALPAAGSLIGCGDDLDPLRDGGVAVLEPWAHGFLVAIWAA